MPGPWMPAGRHLPHDLAQYVVEASTSTTDGFWGLLARGATFRSTGRRVTKPGRALILQHREGLDRAEVTANRCIAAWRSGERTPASEALDAALRQWRELGPDERLVFRWPSAVGEVQPHADD